MAARNYSSVARLATLTAGINNSTTALSVDQVTGFPSVPFTMVIDPGRPAEEIVTVTSVVGLNLVALRGQDGTAAQPHDAAAELRHMATARDFREAAEHVAATSGVHGATGELVDTQSSQSIDNKTFTPNAVDHAPLTVQAAVSQTADLLTINSSGSLRLGGIKPTGRIDTPGIDGSSTSTFTAGTAATVPLIAKGAVSQSANLLSARNDVNTEVASITANGTINGSIVNGGVINGTGSVNAPNVNASQQTVASTTSVGTTPLIVDNPVGQTANSLIVRDGTDATRAGVGNEASGYRAFHGFAGNYLPYMIHCGTVTVVMLTGDTSVGTAVDISGFEYATKPVIFVNVVQYNESALKRRISANTYDESATSFSIRVFQTEGEVMPDNTNYDIRWMCIQMRPTFATG